MQKLILYAKDIAVIMDICEKSSQKLIKKINQEYDLRKNTFIAIDKFAKYTSIEEDIIRNAINQSNHEYSKLCIRCPYQCQKKRDTVHT